MDRYLNVIDVEATCWPGSPPAGEVHEIIQIGVCVVDPATRSRVGRDDILVRPARSRVSGFCTGLTGLTRQRVDTGISFAEACAYLVERHDAGSRRWASWGDHDRKQFQRQCAADDVAYPFGPGHLNAKARYAEAHHLRRPMGMARALAHAGIPLEGRHHDGADDAWNIAALVLTLPLDDDWLHARVGDEREPRAVG